MSTQLKLRRGTTAQHSTFTGASGEITIDTDKNVVIVHDGSTAGGIPQAKDSSVVHNTGDETISGTKTFSSTIQGSISGSSGSCTGNAATATSAGNADTLDGQHGSYYQPASTAITTSNIGSQSVNYATSAGSVADGSVTAAKMANSGYEFGMRNRIINGAMMIDQRNAGASVTITSTSSETYVLDRFAAYGSVGSKFSIQQNAGSVTPPTGFTNYMGITSLSAYTVGSGEVFSVGQRIEGLNVADLGWGTANAQSVTLSFLVRSSLTGTFGGCLQNSAQNRSYPFSYTISSANTWETKTITVAGDTSGTWLTTNGVGIIVRFGLGVGSTLSGTAGSWAGTTYYSATGATSVVGTNGATFYITGVQLEKGSVATPFEFRPYGQELALCQRYYQVGDVHLFSTGTGGDGTVSLPVQMRTSPSYAITDSVGTANCYSDSAGNGLTFAVNANSANAYRLRVQVILARSASWFEFNYKLSAEL